MTACLRLPLRPNTPSATNTSTTNPSSHHRNTHQQQPRPIIKSRGSTDSAPGSSPPPAASHLSASHLSASHLSRASVTDREGSVSGGREGSVGRGVENREGSSCRGEHSHSCDVQSHADTPGHAFDSLPWSLTGECTSSFFSAIYELLVVWLWMCLIVMSWFGIVYECTHSQHTRTLTAHTDTHNTGEGEDQEGEQCGTLVVSLWLQPSASQRECCAVCCLCACLCHMLYVIWHACCSLWLQPSASQREYCSCHVCGCGMSFAAVPTPCTFLSIYACTQ